MLNSYTPNFICWHKHTSEWIIMFNYSNHIHVLSFFICLHLTSLVTLISNPLPTEEFLQNATGMRVANSTRLQEPSKDHQGQVNIIATCQSLTAGNTPQGLHSATCESWAYEHIHSKGDLLVHAHNRCAKREPSLVIGIANVSWLVVSLLGLIKQKQLARGSPTPGTSFARLFCKGAAMPLDLNRQVLK